MNKYRILEEIDNSKQEREKREHIIHSPVVTFILQEYNDYGFLLGGKWNTIEIHKSIESAQRSIEDITKKFVTTKMHKVITHD